MLFVLPKSIEAVADPSLILMILALAGFILLLLSRQSSVGLALLSIGMIGLTACTFLPVGTWLMRPLEDRFPAVRKPPSRVTGIVVLGGAINLVETESRGEPTFNDAAGRMTTFLELAHRYPGAKLLFSGGNQSSDLNGLTEATVARLFFEKQGVAIHGLLLENASHNTHENALYSVRLVHPRLSDCWLLVTSAADMPRAVGSFRAAGWPVVAYPTDYHTVPADYHPNGLQMNPGLAGALRKVDWATHEWLGLIYYWIRGWTATWFPGPGVGPELACLSSTRS